MHPACSISFPWTILVGMLKHEAPARFAEEPCKPVDYGIGWAR